MYGSQSSISYLLKYLYARNISWDSSSICSKVLGFIAYSCQERGRCSGDCGRGLPRCSVSDRVPCKRPGLLVSGGCNVRRIVLSGTRPPCLVRLISLKVSALTLVGVGVDARSHQSMSLSLTKKILAFRPSCLRGMSVSFTSSRRWR